MNRISFSFMLLALLLVGMTGSAIADDVTIGTGVDMYNRYVWRGLDIASTPSVQPALTVGVGGFELGAWGAYTLSNQASGADEIDFWIGYTAELENGSTLSAIVTDYYFPNSGIDFFNFNDYDATIDDTIPNPGAHTIEVGLAYTGPKTFPLTVSAYLNVYNDAGNNTYFQLDYPVTAGDAELNFFVGATGGSKDNPDYYGTDDFQVINIGVAAARDIKVSESLSIPLNVSFVLNPNAEISYLLVGMSL